MNLPGFIGRGLHRHQQFAAAVFLGACALVAVMALRKPLAYPIAANVFFAVYIALVLREMPGLTAAYLSKNARAADLPVLLIFIVTATIVGVAIVSLFQVINDKGTHAAQLVVCLLSVPLGWFALHAMAAIHYAHLYWMDNASTRRREPVGGLGFPETDKPEGWDFLYFSTVIGMTAQTADTDITTTRMRKVVLLHSVVSFFFNTVIVAAAVNLAVSLGS